MVNISAEYQCFFDFPAEISIAFDYYRETPQVFRYLPHIQIVKTHSPNKYRVMYLARELRLYRVRVYCDLEAIADENKKYLRIKPINNGIQSVASSVGISSLKGYGSYSSTSQFEDHGNWTRIDFRLKLSSRLPVPIGLRAIPKNTIQDLANKITQRRVQEIANRFIENSIENFTNRTRH